jgi:hypothetical protein
MEATMKTRLSIIAALSVLLYFGGSFTCASAFSSLAEPGPYFVKALNVTVPLRDDLVWGPAFGSFYWNRNTMDTMRYTARIYYPAIDDVQASDQYSVFFPADTSGAPYPAVVFMQGANVAIEQYAWLFEHIASHGYIILAVTEIMPSQKRLEGQFSNLFPQGTSEPANWIISMMLPDIITYLENINTSVPDPLPPGFLVGSLPDPRDRTSFNSVVRNPRATSGDDYQISLFDGMVDTTNIVLAGHSFGGFMALFCANNAIPNPPRPENGSFTTGIKGCFVYGTHSFTGSGTGYPSAVNVPLLMLAGEKDGVASGPISGVESSGYERIKYTFDYYVPASNDNSRHIIGIKGANHLSIGYRPEPSVDRSFLDEKEGIISPHIAHRIIAEKTTAFLEAYTRNDLTAKSIITGSGSDPFVFDYAAK